MEKPETIIRPKKRWQLINFNELWKYRELFYIFAWRDIKVRYKQTILGVLWVIFQPIVTTIIFTFFFGRLANIPSGALPYFLFVLIGLVFWSFFSGAITLASNSFIENAEIIKKVYFPREILPVAAVVTSSIDFSINFVVVIAVSIFFGFIPSVLVLVVLVLCLIITLFTSIGLGLFLASLNVKYRDVRYILPFFIQILLFLTPVIYSLSSVRTTAKFLLSLNPMTAVIESMRKVISGNNNLDLDILCISLVSAVIIFFLGLSYFRRTERFFADNV